MKNVLIITIAMFLTSVLYAQQKQMNIIFILADDHRYDAMGFMNTLLRGKPD